MPIIEREDWTPTEQDMEVRKQFREKIKAKIRTKKELQEAGHNVDPLEMENLIFHSRESFTEDQLGSIFIEKADKSNLPHEDNVIGTRDQSFAYAHGNLDKLDEFPNRFKKTEFKKPEPDSDE